MADDQQDLANYAAAATTPEKEGLMPNAPATVDPTMTGNMSLEMSGASFAVFLWSVVGIMVTLAYLLFDEICISTCSTKDWSAWAALVGYFVPLLIAVFMSIRHTGVWFSTIKAREKYGSQGGLSPEEHGNAVFAWLRVIYHILALGIITVGISWAFMLSNVVRLRSTTLAWADNNDETTETQPYSLWVAFLVVSGSFVLVHVIALVYAIYNAYQTGKAATKGARRAAVMNSLENRRALSLWAFRTVFNLVSWISILVLMCRKGPSPGVVLLCVGLSMFFFSVTTFFHVQTDNAKMPAHLRHFGLTQSRGATSSAPARRSQTAYKY